MDEVAAGGEADLPLELERGEGSSRSGRIEVGIVEDDEGVVPAQLERDLLEETAGQLAHPPPDGG